MSDEMTIHLKIWRQACDETRGKFVDYTVKDILPEMSFLEMLDLLNEDLVRQGEQPVEFDSDCREGICGTCGLVIGGIAHGPHPATTTCEIRMRHFSDGETITVEPWRAGPFPGSKDLIVDRKGIIRLQQPDKLLEKLSENYVPPEIKEQVRLKVSEGSGTIRELLLKQSQELGLPLVAKGTSSVAQFAVMQRGDVLSVYCPRLEMLLEQLSGNQSDRFPNLELVETDDETVYFDARQEGDFWWTSPVQVYLELMAGDKRDRETAEQVKSFLLAHLEPVQQ